MFLSGNQRHRRDHRFRFRHERRELIERSVNDHKYDNSIDVRRDQTYRIAVRHERLENTGNIG